MLQDDYYAACLRKGVEPQKVDVGPRWLNDLLFRYRVVPRRPNREFKVSL